MHRNRLHIPGIPYTITRDEYSHDAFTNKVRVFAPMMRRLGFEVYHYGVETSHSNATKQIDLMTKDEWTDLRIRSWQHIDHTLTYEDAVRRNADPTQIVNQLSNWDTPLTIEFNARFRRHLVEHYRSTRTDIVCIPLARTYQEALDQLHYVVVETGIGYMGSYLPYRIFESHAWLSHTLGQEGTQPHNYWFVIPHAFDVEEFALSLQPAPRKVGFLGRLIPLKGCNVIVEIARRFPDVQFVLCGQGDCTPYLGVPNVVYHPPIYGQARSAYLGSCVAFLHLAAYLEPFGCGPVEAQLCGTPVISTDWGGMVETVEQGRTGLRGHTLADFCHGVQMALDGAFDRRYIRDRAVRLYGTEHVAHQYDYVFRTVLEVHRPEQNGWYSTETYIPSVLRAPPPVTRAPRMFLCIPYYGAFPNYFQLYLDSLGANAGLLTVLLVTDIDTTSYARPANLVVVPMSKRAVQTRASTWLHDVYGTFVPPDELICDDYKLVDFKVTYPRLFEDLLRSNGATSGDYVGWGDIDVIYGDLARFIDLRRDYDVIGGHFGHFTAVRNTEPLTQLFKAIPAFFQLLTDNTRTFIADEIAYRGPLDAYLSTHRLQRFSTFDCCCDIIPACFYHLSRPDHATWAKNFFDLSNPTKNIAHLHYDATRPALTVLYDTGDAREVLYCHLQKRPMALPFASYAGGFYIHEHAFSLSGRTEVIPRTIWQTWRTHDLPPRMRACVDALRSQHPAFVHRLLDDRECRDWIVEYFPSEVVQAYDALIPAAYKADLWRYCALYVHGGIYLDVKLQFVNGFTLSTVIDREYYVADGEIELDDVTYASIHNGLMVCKPQSPLLRRVIVHIVHNVSTRFMGANPWESTGPRLLGAHLQMPIDRCDFRYGNDACIEDVRTRTRVVVPYAGYREEQAAEPPAEYYQDLWRRNAVYHACAFDLPAIHRERRWPAEWHAALGEVLHCPTHAT